MKLFTDDGRRKGRPVIIAGPCSAESREQVLQTASSVAALGADIFRAGIWKPRTRPGCFEGIGSEGLLWLREVKETMGMTVTTEVATASHAEEALKAGIDILWIGARTTANPFAVQELANALRGTDVPVLVKNPVNPDLELWCGAIQRLLNAGIRNIGVIHRGFSSYEEKVYRNSPIWQIPIELRRRYPDIPLICDPSHIAGRRSLVAGLCQQAMDLRFDGLMIETHCHPECALSDAGQQITPEDLSDILKHLIIRDNNQLTDDINLFRSRIDVIDRRLLQLLSDRMEISRNIGSYKRTHNIPVLQNERYDTIMKDSVRIGEELRLNPDFVAMIIKAIHEESIKQQI